jgi:hypothetical protein
MKMSGKVSEILKACAVKQVPCRGMRGSKPFNNEIVRRMLSRHTLSVKQAINKLPVLAIDFKRLQNLTVHELTLSGSKSSTAKFTTHAQ